MKKRPLGFLTFWYLFCFPFYECKYKSSDAGSKMGTAKGVWNQHC